jgi:hypothetical protein
MVTPTDLLSRLPVFLGNRDIISEDQSTKDIVNEVLTAHEIFSEDYDKIQALFLGGNVEKKLFDFCKKYLPYNIESEDLQTTRSPAGLMAMRNAGCDCKHYAGFIGGVLDAMNRAGVKKTNWFYRFASYDFFDEDVKHVFIIVKNDNGEIWIDPVLNNFDGRSPYPAYKVDKKPKKMSLVRLSGVPAKIQTSHTIAFRSDMPSKYGESFGCNGGLGSAVGYNNCTGAASMGSFSVSDFIAKNPLPALAIGGGLIYLLYKTFK